MITRMEVEARMATVAYVNNEMEPVSPDDADMVKIIFDDGEVRFGVRAEPNTRKSQYAAEKRRAHAWLKD